MSHIGFSSPAPHAADATGAAPERWPRRLRRRLLVVVFGLSLALTTGILAYESQLWPRLAEKVQPRAFPFTRVDAALVRAAAQQSREQLLHPPARQGNRAPGLRAEAWLRGTSAPPSADSWMQAAVALGLVQAQTVAPDPSVREALAAYRDELITGTGRWRATLRSPEQAFAGWFLLRGLDERDESNRAVRQACDQLAEFILKQYPQTASATVPYSADHPEAMLVDTLGLLCPFLATYARVSGRTEAADLAVRQLLEFQGRAVDRASGLPWHAYSARSGGGYGILGWARASGWLLIGLSETLVELPGDHPERPALTRALEEGLRSVIERQQPDGLWGWCLTIPDAEPDTSGTAMILWAAAKAKQSGIDSEPIRAAVGKARSALARRIDDSGRVTQALGECQAVGHYPRLFGSFPFAQGLATGALALQLNQP